MKITHEIVQPTPKVPFKYYFHDENSPRRVAPHWHRNIELGFMVSKNTILVKDDNQENEYHQGDIWVINSRDIHETTFINRKSVFVFCLLIDYDFLKKIYPDIDQIHFDLKGKPACLKQLIAYQELEKQLRMMIQLLQEPRDDTFNLDLTGRIYILMANLINNFSHKVTSNTSVNESLIDQALGLINSSYTEDLNGTVLAHKLNTSVTTLNQQFHQTVQMSITKYITTVRLLAAQKKLLNTNQNIDYIAIDSGFNSTKSFIRNFKNWKHTTPYQYRKNFAELERI